MEDGGSDDLPQPLRFVFLDHGKYRNNEITLMNFRQLICCGVVSALLPIVMVNNVSAQQTQSSSPDLKSEQRELQRREAMLRTVETGGFIDNPILKSPGEKIDAELSTRAGSDLTTIIELSGNIK